MLNLWFVAKAVPRENFLKLNVFIRKLERFKIKELSNQSNNLKQLQK